MCILDGLISANLTNGDVVLFAQRRGAALGQPTYCRRPGPVVPRIPVFFNHSAIQHQKNSGDILRECLLAAASVRLDVLLSA
jgi:hypothetical protein